MEDLPKDPKAAELPTKTQKEAIMRIYLKQASIALIFLAATSTELHAGFIPDDCANFGVFIANICFLTKDTSEPLVIVADNVGIDGQGHTIFGSGTPEPCLTVDGDNTLVTDLNFEGCDFGAVTFDHNGNRFEDVNCTEVGICNFANNTTDTEIIGGACDGGGLCEWAIGTTGWTRLDGEYHCSTEGQWFGVIAQDGQNTTADGLDFHCDVDSPGDQVNFLAEGQKNLQLFNWSQGFSNFGYFGVGNDEVILDNFEADFDVEILEEGAIVQWITHDQSRSVIQNNTAIELDITLKKIAFILGTVLIGDEDVVIDGLKFRSRAKPDETAFTAGLIVVDSVDLQIQKASVFGANASILLLNTVNASFRDSKIDQSGGALFEVGDIITFTGNEVTDGIAALGLDGEPDPFLEGGANFRFIGELDVEDNEFTGVPGDGMFLEGISDFIVSGNVLEDMIGSGLIILESNNGRIRENDIIDVLGDGIQLIDTDGVLIESNVIEGVVGAGLTLMNANDNQIFLNDIEDCGGLAFQDIDSTGNLFINNEIEDCPNEEDNGDEDDEDDEDDD